MAEKKLSLKKLDSIIKSTQSPVINTIKYAFGEETYEITVKRYIDFSSTLGFVSGVVDSVFPVADDGTTHYAPEILDYVKALHYIEYFSNLKVELGASRVYAMLYSTEIMRDIYKLISSVQYNSLEDAIDSAIAHKLAILQSGEQAKIAEATDKIDKASQALENLTNQFDGFDQNTMQAAFNNLATIEPKDLAGAVIDIRDKK